MSRLMTAVCVILCLLPGAAHANGDLTQILDHISTKYGNLPGLSLSYEREVTTKTMTMLGDQVKGDLATGTMFFKPPYFLKLEQKTPNPETIVSNGDVIWWHIPEQNRVLKYPAEGFGKELRLLSDIFHGLIKVEERFQVSLLKSGEKEEYRIELRPDPAWQSIEHILLTVTGEHDIRFVSIHYQLGSVTRFTLDNITEKNDYEKDFFIFNVPEGAKLIEEKVSLE